MPEAIQCSSCGARFQVPDAMRGKSLKCPKCQATINVPAAGSVGPVRPVRPVRPQKPSESEAATATPATASTVVQPSRPTAGAGQGLGAAGGADFGLGGPGAGLGLGPAATPGGGADFGLGGPGAAGGGMGLDALGPTPGPAAFNPPELPPDVPLYQNVWVWVGGSIGVLLIGLLIVLNMGGRRDKQQEASTQPTPTETRPSAPVNLEAPEAETPDGPQPLRRRTDIPPADEAAQGSSKPPATGGGFRPVPSRGVDSAIGESGDEESSPQESGESRPRGALVGSSAPRAVPRRPRDAGSGFEHGYPVITGEPKVHGEWSPGPPAPRGGRWSGFRSRSIREAPDQRPERSFWRHNFEPAETPEWPDPTEERRYTASGENMAWANWGGPYFMTAEDNPRAHFSLVVKTWDLIQDRPLGEFTTPPHASIHSLEDLVLSPFGDRIAVMKPRKAWEGDRRAGFEGGIIAIDPASGEVLDEILYDGRAISSINSNPVWLGRHSLLLQNNRLKENSLLLFTFNKKSGIVRKVADADYQALAAVPDGSLFAAADQRGIDVYQGRGARRVGRLALEPGSEVINLAFSDDGSTLAVLLTDTNSGNQRVFVYSMIDGLRQSLIPGVPDATWDSVGHSLHETRPLELNRDGSLVLVGREYLYASATGDPIGQLALDKSNAETFDSFSMRMSPDGWLLMSREGGPFKSEKKVELGYFPFPQHDTLAEMLQAAENLDRIEDDGLPELATIEWPDDAVRVNVRNQEAAAEIRSSTQGDYPELSVPLEVPLVHVQGVFVAAPQFNRCVVVSVDTTHDVQNWQFDRQSKRSPGSNESTTPVAEEEILPRLVRVVDLATGKTISQHDLPSGITVLDVSPDGQRYVTASSMGRDRIDVWNAEDGRHILGFRPIPAKNPGRQVPKDALAAASLSFSRVMLADSQTLVVQWSSGLVAAWRIDQPECLWWADLGQCTPLIPSPNGQYLLGVLVGDQAKFLALELATGQVASAQMLKLEQPLTSSARLAVDSTGERLALTAPWRVIHWELGSDHVVEIPYRSYTSCPPVWVDSNHLWLGGYLMQLDRKCLVWHFYEPVGIVNRQGILDRRVPMMRRYNNQFLAAVADGPDATLIATQLPTPEATKILAERSPAGPPRQVFGRGIPVRLDVSSTHSVQEIRETWEKRLEELGVPIQANAEFVLRVSLKPEDERSTQGYMSHQDRFKQFSNPYEEVPPTGTANWTNPIIESYHKDNQRENHLHQSTLLRFNPPHTLDISNSRHQDFTQKAMENGVKMLQGWGTSIGQTRTHALFPHALYEQPLVKISGNWSFFGYGQSKLGPDGVNDWRDASDEQLEWPPNWQNPLEWASPTKQTLKMWLSL